MAPRARNPETGEMIEWNGSEWVRVAPDAPRPVPIPPLVRGPGLPVNREGPIRGLLGSAMQGGSFEFGDEALAGLQTIGDLMGGNIGIGGVPSRYRARVGDIRRSQEDYAARRPKTALGARIGGGMLTGGAAGAGLAGTGVAATRPLLAAIAGGGAAGGLTGAGQAETLAEVPEQAARSGLLGAVAGGVGYPIAQGVTRTVGAGVRGLTRPSVTPAQQARRKVGQALSDDAVESIDDLARSMRDLGPEGRVVDAGGRNTEMLGRAVASMPGRAQNVAKEVLEGRKTGQFPRLMDALRSASGKDGVFLRHVRGAVQARKAKADPLYAAARRDAAQEADVAGVAKFIADKADDFANTPTGRALNRVRRGLFRGDGETLKTNIGRDLHAVKVDLDGQIGRAKRAGDNALTKQLMDVKERLLSVLDKSSAYNEARRTFAGDSAMIDAMEMGRRVLREDAEEMAETVAAMTAGERDAFAIGAVKAVRDKVGAMGDAAASGANPALRLINSENARNALRLALGDAYEPFLRAVNREGRFSEVSNIILRNSTTEPTKEAISGLAEAGVDIATGQGPLVTLLRRAKDFLGRGNTIPREVRDEIGKILFETPEEEVSRALRRIQMPKEDYDRIIRQIAMGQSTGAASGLSVAAP